MKYFTLLLFSFLMFSAAAQTTSKTESDKTKETSKKTCAVKVSFGSPGTGIDGKTYDAIKAMISDKKLKFTEKNIGREGETEICLPLKELKRSKKSQFIEQLKKTAAAGQFVSVSVN
jgi:hypothetical protein